MPPLAHTIRIAPHAKRPQQGAAFIVMMVILIIGVTAALVGALSKVGIQNARTEVSSDMLAQSKEIVIGYILQGGVNQPGWMISPDVLDTPSSTEKLYNSSTQGENYDGQSDAGCFNVIPPYTPRLTSSPEKKRCLGRLPWKSLGMSISSPSENDPTGFMPWYAFSRNLTSVKKQDLVTDLKINSELLNADSNLWPWLKVYDMNGNLLSDRVAFVIMIPGVPLEGQSRPPSPNLAGPNQYLDSISVPAGCTPSGTPCTTTYSNYDLTERFVTGEEHRWMADPADPSKQIEDPTYQFNDKLLYVTIDELMPLIEKRIAREVKSCLDDYAAWPTNTSHRYPWAALVSDTTAYPNRDGSFHVHFGRMPDTPNTSTSSGGSAPTGTLLSYIQAVQTALTNYLANPTSGRLSTLNSKGDLLKDLAKDPPYNQSVTDPARAAGITADNCASTACGTTLQNQLDTAMGLGTPDPTMPATWSTTSCDKLLNSSYWPDWRDLVFYQVAEGYQPGGGTFTPLHISGSGNPIADNNTYRAVVSIAGKSLGQTRPSFANPPNNYLETSGGITNAHSSVVATSPSTNFITYKPSDTINYSTVNDLVLCLDGKTNCQ